MNPPQPAPLSSAAAAALPASLAASACGAAASAAGAPAVNVAAEKAHARQGIHQLELDARLLVGLTPAQKDLFEYYKYRVATFEAERAEWAGRMEDLEGTRADYHKVRWELTRRDEQVAELQRALSDAHVFLYEEREQVLRLAAENDELRIQELEDRKRIQHLLALTQPVAQEVTYFRDCRPGKVTRQYAPVDRSAGAGAGAGAVKEATAAGTGAAAGGAGTSSYGAATSAGKAAALSAGRAAATGATTGPARPRTATSTTRSVAPPSFAAAGGVARVASGRASGAQVVRTIHMPSETVDVLKLIVQSLRTQLDEQKCFAEQRCQALTEDRIIREAEAKERDARAQRTIAGLQSDMRALMELQAATTKDYLDLRQTLQDRERALREELAALSAELRAAKLALSRQEEERAARDSKRQQEAESFVAMFRNQALGSEEDLAIIKGQYEAAHALYEKRVKYLEAKLANAVQRYKAVQERRKLEMEGYSADVKASRERLRDLERLVGNLRVVDGASGVAGVDPRVVRMAAFRKDFTDLKTHLADIAHRLDKGDPAAAKQFSQQN